MQIVLNTPGTSISCENNGFVISNSNGKKRLSVEGVDSIIMGKGSDITSGAVLLAIDNEIEILFVDRHGTPKGRIWSHKYGSISTIRKGQIQFTQTPDALNWIKGIISKKIENQQALLLMFSADTVLAKNTKEKAIARIEEYRTKVLALKGDTVGSVAAQLRGWEGSASRIYFEAISTFLPERLQFNGRSQHPAKDPFNAFLNYGYGILYGRIEGALIKAGIDPYVGVMHRDEYNRPVLVFDVIEQYRIWVDYIVTDIFIQDIITDEYYSVNEDGSYWLESLGRRVISQSMNDYLAEIIKVKGIERSRDTAIELYAQELAQKFKKYE